MAPQWQLPNTIVNSEGWEIRKLTTGQGEDYTAGCLLDYDYIKNRCRLIAVDLSRQKEQDADPKAIQQIDSMNNLKNE